MELLKRFPISALAESDVVPGANQYPPTSWTHECTLGDKYEPAFDAQTQEDADAHLLLLVGHSLRYGRSRNAEGFIVSMSWRQAFAYERTELAWFAFARDIGQGELYRREQDSQGNWGRVERTTARDFVRRMYGAELPASITGKPAEGDILERVRQKREKAAKARGEAYWRKAPKVPATPAPVQGGLF